MSEATRRRVPPGVRRSPISGANLERRARRLVGWGFVALLVVGGLFAALFPLFRPSGRPAPRHLPLARSVQPDVERDYEKFEYDIPMRDGVTLFTSVYVPRDTRLSSYPILLQRTPYGVGPYGKDMYRASLGPSDLFTGEGYIFAYQDVRGQGHSDGEWEEMRPIHEHHKHGETDEATDTYDTVDWLVKNIPHNNGRVGLWGISYPGFYAAIGAVEAHPAVKAISPQAPATDWFRGDDDHHNGCLFLPHAFTYYADQTKTPFNAGTEDGYDFFLKTGPIANVDKLYFHEEVPWWTKMVQHSTYDEFWKDHSLLPHLKNVKAAVLTVGGWFDAEDLFGALNTYRSIEKTSPARRAPAPNRLVMGPWSHGSWASGDGDHLGAFSFGSPTAAFFRENIELAFFNFYLKYRGKGSDLPEAYVFETGGNRWRAFKQWPPKEATEKALYLHAGGRLTFDPPTAAETPYDAYVSDPANPVPYTASKSFDMNSDYMFEDQRFLKDRKDVLTYQTDPLAADVTVAGPVTPRLFAATSATDSDFIVKLIDVYPDTADPADDSGPAPGSQILIRGEPFRARYRKGLDKAVPMTPNQPDHLEYVLPDVCHTFKKGHRIMVQVQSTWFPLVERNPQKFVPNVAFAAPSDFVKATERIYHTKAQASEVQVLTLSP